MTQQDKLPMAAVYFYLMFLAEREDQLNITALYF